MLSSLDTISFFNSNNSAAYVCKAASYSYLISLAERVFAYHLLVRLAIDHLRTLICLQLKQVAFLTNVCLKARYILYQNLGLFR